MTDFWIWFPPIYAYFHEVNAYKGGRVCPHVEYVSKTTEGISTEFCILVEVETKICRANLISFILHHTQLEIFKFSQECLTSRKPTRDIKYSSY